MDTLENEENDYKRQVKKFHKGMEEIKVKKETLAQRERDNQKQMDEFEANKENWGAELKAKEAQRKEAREKFKKADDILRLRNGTFYNYYWQQVIGQFFTDLYSQLARFRFLSSNVIVNNLLRFEITILITLEEGNLKVNRAS